MAKFSKPLHRAERIGTGGISSDDPDAIYKLELKLENLQKSHAIMIAGNKVLRKKSLSDEDKIEQLFCLGFSEKHAKEVV
ncbi:hypothetical protein O3W44_20995 [Pantoea sp. LMR881]|uniref:hypothetical protein n=1 Tax=Pantoea sp. LMR881 TaxID=3014336 RepID=UPI0022AEAAE9|nr:hypothetical protein [Pantoea sp. LMR881]MCZ4061033.1 hypothetical protein [Pantoea sp. LMR881]